MANREGSLERSLATQYALEVLGKENVKYIFGENTDDVRLVEIEERPTFTELANGRPVFDRLLEPGTILTTTEGKKTWPNGRPKSLFERLNMSVIPVQRRQDLGGMIGEQLTFESEETPREWRGAGLPLLAETRAKFAAEVNSPAYESLVGKSVFFPGVLLVGRQGVYVPSIQARGGGPKIGIGAFQQDYDVDENAWVVARGSGTAKIRPPERSSK